VLLVDLDILSEFDPAMFVVVDVEPCHNGAGTQCLRDAQTVRESIESDHCEKHHLDDHSRRVVLDGSGIVGAACPFLGGTDGTFDIWHMLAFAANVQLRTDVGSHCAAGAFEFAVAKNVGNDETAFAIYAVDALEGLNEGGCFPVLEDFAR
jgi:hypothetical protein